MCLQIVHGFRSWVYYQTKQPISDSSNIMGLQFKYNATKVTKPLYLDMKRLEIGRRLQRSNHTRLLERI